MPLRPVTNIYSYTNSEWGDLLTSYNGTAITYDEIGNPLSYYNGSSYTFTWRGRELIGAVKWALFEGGITFESVMFGCIVGGICGFIAGAGADNVKAGHHVTKFVNSCKILNSTIANGTKSAIAHQRMRFCITLKS